MLNIVSNYIFKSNNYALICVHNSIFSDYRLRGRILITHLFLFMVYDVYPTNKQLQKGKSYR